MRFKDRSDAGRQLATLLDDHLSKKQKSSMALYALPRGGVAVAYEIAEHFGVPINLLITRKLSHPYNPEYAIGAVSEHSQAVLDQAETSGINPKWLEGEANTKLDEIKRRRIVYGHAHWPPVYDSTAIVVDDGIATGSTIKAALADLRLQQPKVIIVAVPMLPADVYVWLSKEVDDVISIDVPRIYRGSVGAYYTQFNQLNDHEVVRLLAKANAIQPVASAY